MAGGGKLYAYRNLRMNAVCRQARSYGGGTAQRRGVERVSFALSLEKNGHLGENKGNWEFLEAKAIIVPDPGR